jgi:hypothetical protein
MPSRLIISTGVSVAVAASFFKFEVFFLDYFDPETFDMFVTSPMDNMLYPRRF